MLEGTRNERAARTHYSRAPVSEAVIDIHARLRDDIPLTALRDARWSGEGRYTEPKPRYQGNVRFDATGTTPAISTEQSQVGWLFRDDDKQQVIQARRDGFALSKLAPYDRWEPFCKEARTLWLNYCEAVQPLDVTRIAVRYINRLDLPLPFDDFREYLRTYPEVSPALPQGLRGFLIQLQIPQEDIGGMLIVNEGILESARPDIAPILLDIDLSQPVMLAPDSGELWEALEGLHARKNSVFEACITDKMRELIR